MYFQRFLLILTVFMTSTTLRANAETQTCEELADQRAQTAYRTVYERVFNDCRAGQPIHCQTNRDCQTDEQCVSGRCVAGTTSCVKRCIARWNNGECREYGSDYCAIDPICVTKCLQRFSNGQCRSYASDVCGTKPLSCVVRCVERFSTGECKSFGEDYCGPNPQCSTRCTARRPNGECREYGADACAG
jgi:hypothetical protein